MKQWLKKSILGMGLLALSANGALAALSAVGPLNPDNGFPQWYEDANGTRLQLCLDTAGFCLPLDGVNPGNPIEFPGNFPVESFYWTGENVATVDGGGDVLMVLALEAAFVNEVPVDGDRVVFARIRLRGQGLLSGHYRITYPYGVQEFDVVAGPGRVINFTDDVGIDTPEVFTTALAGQIGPFLMWDPAVAPAAPAGHLGDPAIDHSIIGSPLGTNFLKIERLEGGVFVQVGFNDQFAISGKISQAAVSANPRSGNVAPGSTVTLTASDPASDIFFTTDGSDPKTSATAVQFVAPIVLAPGTTVLKFFATDGVNETDVVTETYTADDVAPTVTAPTQAFQSPGALAGGGIPTVISWTGADNVGVASYELQQSVNSAPFAAVALPTPTSTSVTLNLAFGSTQQFQVRAADAAGNVSTFALGGTFTVVKRENTSPAIRFSPSWRTFSSAGASGGSIKASSVTGATARYTFTGSSIAWVATKRANRGIAQVFVDGVMVATVDLFSAATQSQQIVFAQGGLAPGQHTLRIRVTGTHSAGSTSNRVDLDAVVRASP